MASVRFCLDDHPYPYVDTLVCYSLDGGIPAGLAALDRAYNATRDELIRRSKT